MKSYNGDKKLKAMMVAEMKIHAAQDSLVKGTYQSYDGEKFKGCAVGCGVRTLNLKLGLKLSYGNHTTYAEALGIPTYMARLEDKIFEGLEEKEAQKWPQRFLEAIPVGKDLSSVWPKFAQWLLNDVKQYTKNKRSLEAIDGVIKLYDRWVKGDKPDIDEWRKVRAAAYAADAAAYAAYAAADAAYAAAYAAADAAAYAAYAAADAAAYAAYAAARRIYWDKLSDKLIELIKECK